ncbi:peptidoglycan lipid II flippase MviN/MurJ [Pontimonas salivibrio]|uniref:Peptidoglycan lipid II flippase MviN/MurJ n=1 Tax=Pontimonas salivibrio TaxID=1159327 RepID=A0A2L2BNG4_9MICO|nr:lipid II flippase MurJ [Pontimonas salivibrio]AVG23152.1 peptidoglycan lipid II flippase MviN/MurJ [Pontimonas salivibrio]
MANPAATGGDNLGRAGALLASGTIVSRILGFASAILLARILGTVGSGADTFALANQLPNNIYALIAGGVLTAVLVPHIVRAGAHADGGTAYINKIVTLGFIVFLVLAAIATLLAPLLVTLYAQEANPGQRGFSANDMALATALAYWSLPQVLFYALYSLLGEVLNARKVFGPFTWAPVLNNLVFIAGLLIFNALFGNRDVTNALEWTGSMVALLAGGATAGIAAQAFILLVFWRRAGVSYRPDFHWRGVGLAKTGRAAGWLFGMIFLAQIAGVVQANVATLATSEGQPGLAVLRFSWLLFMVPHSVIAVSLATAYFTRMATHARDGDTDKVVSDVTRSIRQIGAMMILASAGLLVLSLPFATLFGGTAENIEAMGLVISAYAIGLATFSVVFVIQRVFYSLDDTRTPFVFQLVHTGVFIFLALSTSTFASDQLAAGLAISASLASFAQLAVALLFLRRALPALKLGAIVLRLAGFVLATLPAILVGVLIVVAAGGLEPTGFARASVFGAASVIAGVGLVMATMYIGVLLVVKNQDMREIVGGTRRLIQRVFTGRE